MEDPSSAVEKLTEFGQTVIFSGPFAICCIVVFGVAVFLRKMKVPPKYVCLGSLAMAIVLVSLSFKPTDMPGIFPYKWLEFGVTGMIVWVTDFLAHGIFLSKLGVKSPFESGNTQHIEKDKR